MSKLLEGWKKNISLSEFTKEIKSIIAKARYNAFNAVNKEMLKAALLHLRDLNK